MRAANLFSAEERRTSATWNEALPKAGTRNGLNVRLHGRDGLRVTWVIADPVAGDWDSGRIRTIRRLLPHLRHFIRVRQALAGAAALGSSLIDLVGHASLAAIHLDRRGRIALANDRALGLLEGDNGLRQEDGLLRAWRSQDDDRLARLLGAVLTGKGAKGAGGNVRVRHPLTGRVLTLHVRPVTARQRGLRRPGPGGAGNDREPGRTRPASMPAGWARVLGLTAGGEPGGGAAGRRQDRARHRRCSQAAPRAPSAPTSSASTASWAFLGGRNWFAWC